MNSLPKTVTRQRRGCDLNPGPSAPESSMLTTRLPSHPVSKYQGFFNCHSAKTTKLRHYLADKIKPTNTGQKTLAENNAALKNGASKNRLHSKPMLLGVLVSIAFYMHI